MADRNETDPVTGVSTTGHEWDGIKELNNPMPLWWLYIFYASVAFAAFYVVLYPAIPMVTGATAGMLGYASRASVEADIAAVDAANAAATERVAAASYDEIRSDAELSHFALRGGAAVFRTNCSQCHGAGGAGAVGYPNLLDDDWLWGGTLESIQTTIAAGINASHPDTRYAEMMAFGDLEILDDDQIAAVVEHVVSLSGGEHDGALAGTGAAVFAEQCSSCHGEGGEGIADLGAPTLNDAIWLYGGTREALTATIQHGRAGVMPSWDHALSEAEIKEVTLYVHALGGGE
ncbi:MAG: cytochrome-c oxidase, cbb3-type subunit III [Pseudomonadota bacterium]